MIRGDYQNDSQLKKNREDAFEKAVKFLQAHL